MKITEIQMTPDVIEALNEELEYTETLQAQGRADANDYGVSGQLTTLATYFRRAQDAWTMNPGNEPCLDELRKVAAIAIRALIRHGCPRRKF
jgi:phosphopantothenate synthetase